jgi:cyclomaltodextrinase / maltogenic alpha-amylase / neopullulanase
MQDHTISTPDWVRDAVFYQIFPDRFAQSAQLVKPSNLESWDATPTFHGYKGGDLLGVVERLPYLKELGVNAIYFNPIFRSASVHRYHTHDYYVVDPLLGGNEAFRLMLDAAHREGIRVVLDGVFNHASRGFFQFHDILESGTASPYLDWFTIKGFPINAYDESRPASYDAWWNLHALPKFNVANPQVREYLMQVGEYWVREGIDGWRLDVPAEIKDDSLWRELRQRVKAQNPEAYIVGEIWHDARHWLRGDQFDAVMNYLFTKLCIEFFIGVDVDPSLIKGTSLWPVRHIAAPEFAEEINALLKLYPPEVTAVQMNLLGSHDTARYLTLAGGDASALKLATLFSMVYPGAPCIYYGDEVGMTGGRDPLSRGGFPWDESRWDGEMLQWFRKSTALRKRYVSLRRGDYTTLLGQGSVYAFGRSVGSECLVVVFNAGYEAAGVNVPVAGYLPDDAALTDVWGEGGRRYAVGTGTITMQMAPRSAAVLLVEAV